MLLLVPMVVNASGYTYELNGIGNLSGSVTTDCNNCALTQNDFTAWTITRSAGDTFGPVTSTSSVPGASVTVLFQNSMVATPTAITFDFGSGSVMYFKGDPTSQDAYIEFAGAYSFLDNDSDIGVVFTCIGVSGGANNCGNSADYKGVQTIATRVPSVVTYAFTGMVTSATGIYSSAGSAVTGTFMIDFAGGDGALPVPFTSPWSSFSVGSSPVVRSTLKSGGVTFSDAGSAGNITGVAGLATAEATAPDEYFAYDTEFSDPLNSREHSFELAGGTGPSAPFDANGLPVFSNATGGASGTLNAYSDNATVGQLNYTITSLTPVPTVSLSPLSLSFPSTAVGSASTPLAVTLTNTSAEQLSITDITLTGGQTDDFALTHTCSASLAVDASCTISVTFKPVAAGAKRATFTVIDNARVSQRSVTLTGVAAAVPAPALTLSTTSLNFARFSARKPAAACLKRRCRSAGVRRSASVG